MRARSISRATPGSNEWAALLNGLAPRAVDGIAVEGGGTDALVGRWRQPVPASGAGLGDERAVGPRLGLDGLFEQPVEEHSSRP